MTQEIRSNVAIKSTTLNRSGLRTTNMTSTTPDHQEGTSWKNVQVDENGNFVVGPNPGGGSSDGNLTFSTTAGLAPTSPSAPAVPPSPVISGDTHRETYDDKILWWTWNGTSWVLNDVELVATPSTSIPSPTAPAAPAQSSGYSQSVTNGGAPDGSTAYTLGYPMLNWTDNSSGNASFEVWMDGDYVTTVSAGVTTYNTSGVSEGVHTWSIYAKIGPSYSTAYNIGPISVVASPDAALLYNTNGSNLVKIDIASNTVLDTVSVGANSGQIVMDNTDIFVVGTGTNSIKKVNRLTHSVTGTASITGPMGVIENGDFVYATSFNGGAGTTLLKIDKNSMSISAIISGLSGPRKMVIDGGFLYVTNSGANEIKKIDLSTFTVTATLTGISGGESMVIDGGFLYVSCLTGNTIRKIDLSTFIEISSLGIIAVSRSLLIKSGFLYAQPYNTSVIKIDLSTFTITSTLTYAGSAINMDADENKLYLPQWASSGIRTVDFGTFTLNPVTINTPSTQPNGIIAL